jgi:hypothetical protein
MWQKDITRVFGEIPEVSEYFGSFKIKSSIGGDVEGYCRIRGIQVKPL